MSQPEALYLGPSQRLFGMHHAANGPARDTAIVLCNSWGPEYMRSYRAYYRLADALAERGFDTLRFDYSCSGDSAGYTGQASVAQWIEDIHHASAEARRLAGVDRICLVGLRVGGLLALQAAQQSGCTTDIVLWDTPERGADWIDGLTAMDLEIHKRKNRVLPSAHQWPHDSEQLLGSPWPSRLSREIARLDLRAQDHVRMLSFQSADAATPALLHSEQLQVLPDESHWTKLSWLTTPWLPIHSVRIIGDSLASWLH
jgi:predicted alpha/beta hydrolase